MVLHNTLVAGNFDEPTGTHRSDVNGTLDPAGDYNLLGDGTGMGGLSNGVNGNQVGTATNAIDPPLGPLADNGGPTLTHALLPGSPASDAGNNAYATNWDQRGPGYPRIVNGIIDIGAFEVQAPAASRPTGQPLPLPVPVQGSPARPLLGPPPDLPADPAPRPDAPPPPTAGRNPGPVALLPTETGTGQPVGLVGPSDTDQLDPLGLQWLAGS